AKTERTPESTGKLSGAEPSAQSSSEGGNKLTKETYSSAVGALQWIANQSRPDIAHAVNMLARDVKEPTAESLLRARRVLRYLKGTAHMGLQYSRRGPPRILAFSDSDWAGDSADARSTT